jgi:hypothetical protein
MQMNYSGLVVRCASDPERERIVHEHSLSSSSSPGDSLDHVVSGAVGRQEDNQADNATARSGVLRIGHQPDQDPPPTWTCPGTVLRRQSYLTDRA